MRTAVMTTITTKNNDKGRELIIEKKLGMEKIPSECDSLIYLKSIIYIIYICDILVDNMEKALSNRYRYYMI